MGLLNLGVNDFRKDDESEFLLLTLLPLCTVIVFSLCFTCKYHQQLLLLTNRNDGIASHRHLKSPEGPPK